MKESKDERIEGRKYECKKEYLEIIGQKKEEAFW